MKKISIIVMILLSVTYSIVAFAQAPPEAGFGIDYGHLMGGGSYSEDDFGGWVNDGNGNVFILHANKEIEINSSDIIITKMQLSDGSVVWQKRYGNSSRGERLIEPGGNGITVGGAGTSSIAMDENGDLYFTCSIHTGFYRIYVAKVNPTDGSLMWEKSWKNTDNDLASSEAVAYAVDVAGGKVFVAGTTANTHLLLAYDAANGDLVSTTHLDLNPGSGDKSYAVRATPDGNSVYIAGWTSKNFQDGVLAKLSNSGTQLEWYVYIDFPMASRITDLDLDASGNVYLCSDIHGGYTYLEVIKIDPDGNLVWEKTYGSGNDRFNGTTINVIGDYFYLTGRVGLSDDYTHYDNNFGDGIFLKYDLDGNILEKYFYFTGTDNSVLAADWVKGVTEYGGKVYAAGGIYPKAFNYTGQWFVAPDHAGVDTGFGITKETTPANFYTDQPGYDAGLTIGSDVYDHTSLVEDITDANATTYGATQLYLWGFDKSVSVSEVDGVEMTIYPNPASEILYVTIGDNSKYAEISLVNIAGQVVANKKYNDIDIKTIDISNIETGIYLLEVKTENFSVSKKIVIK